VNLIINADIHVVVEILKSLGFEVELLNENIFEAKLRDNTGKFPVLGTILDEKRVYLGLHRDSLLHFMFLGVDYAKKPARICSEILDFTAKMGIKGEIAGGTSWFNKRNKALFRGIKI